MTTTALCMQIEPLTSAVAAVAWKVLKYEAGNHKVPLKYKPTHNKMFLFLSHQLVSGDRAGDRNMEYVYFLTNVSVFMEIFRRF